MLSSTTPTGFLCSSPYLELEMNKEDIEDLHQNLHRIWEFLVDEGKLSLEESEYEELDVRIDEEMPAHKRYNKQQHTAAVFALCEDISASLNPGDEFHDLGKLRQRMTEHRKKRAKDI